MHVKNIALLALAFGGAAHAYPSILEEVAKQKHHHNQKRSTVGWSPDQKVDVTGPHEFKPPGPDDRRGPCPGLNALANHGYIPRNGIATVPQFVKALTKVFSMGSDLATFLSNFGAVISGDLMTWSIGGPPPETFLSQGGLLGRPQGISGSHNKYECDNSPTRGDLYQYGDNFRVQPSQFEDMYSRQAGVPEDKVNYDVAALDQFRKDRIQQSISGNPYYFSGPGAIIVSLAAYAFIVELFSNHTEEHPEGILNREVLKSFFGVSGEPGSFVYNHGHERIPDNWYKRPDDYGIAKLAQDGAKVAAADPTAIKLGGNTGTVNSFAGIDPADLTGGIYNAKNLFEGNNLFCFAFQGFLITGPDILQGGIISWVLDAVNFLTSNIKAGIAGLGCPELEGMDKSRLEQYPGWTKLRSDGTYPPK